MGRGDVVMTNKDSWTPSPEQVAMSVARNKIEEQSERIKELEGQLSEAMELTSEMYDLVWAINFKIQHKVGEYNSLVQKYVKAKELNNELD